VLIKTLCLDVRERVERALRQDAATPGISLRPSDYEVATMLEDLHHPAHRVLGFAASQCFDGRDLRERRGTRRRVDH